MPTDLPDQPSPAPRGHPRFAWRAMTSVLLSCSFLVLLASGLVLFVAPPGRVANWSGWNILGIEKHGWGGLHIWFATIFLAASILHIFYNWRILLAYFKNRHTRRMAFRLEWAVALLVCVGAFAGTRAGIIPFSSLLDLNERVKNSWEGADTRGGGSHASSTGAVRSCESTAAAKGSGSPEGGGGLRGGGPGGGGGGGGGGMGRRTLAEVCASEKVEIQQALDRLQARGITAQPDQTVRDIAAAGKIGRPGEIVTIIRGEQASEAHADAP